MCGCIEKINDMLKPHNTELTQMFSFGSQKMHLSIQTNVIEKRRGKKAMLMTPTCCPFCGVKYEVTS